MCREDVAAGVPPLAFVDMKNVLDVKVAHDQRNTLALIRQGQVTHPVCSHLCAESFGTL